MERAWRNHPDLRARFLADHPDDLQVLVHDGGPRLSRLEPEAVWVTVTAAEGGIFRGRILNQPHRLRTIRLGSEIRFMVAAGAEYPLMVTAKYIRERGQWIVHPCGGCGFSELFDAPSDLIRAIFPDSPEGGVMSMFTSFCPLCGGVQGVESRANRASDGDDPDDFDEEPRRAKRPWWRFWG